MIKIIHKGDFSKTEKFLNAIKGKNYLNVLSKYGQKGVDALKAATPINSGETAQSWTYEIVQENDKATIYWLNTNINKGVNIALILQYGHGTGTGGYVAGRDYINPAIRPIFDNIASEAWKEVTSI
jgi:hypothetical protein